MATITETLIAAGLSEEDAELACIFYGNYQLSEAVLAVNALKSSSGALDSATKNTGISATDDVAATDNPYPGERQRVYIQNTSDQDVTVTLTPTLIYLSLAGTAITTPPFTPAVGEQYSIAFPAASGTGPVSLNFTA